MLPMPGMKNETSAARMESSLDPPLRSTVVSTLSPLRSCSTVAPALDAPVASAAWAVRFPADVVGLRRVGRLVGGLGPGRDGRLVGSPVGFLAARRVRFAPRFRFFGRGIVLDL
ncbi:hypothetical protein BRC70_03775 [Halobacteriales archaeon QH_6_68_27]|nr:MAG: hypothetical protein BRC70_03775 [Halobacteriales archaeon QH_6_68_27]